MSWRCGGLTAAPLARSQEATDDQGANGSLGCIRRSRLSAEQALRLVLGMALFRDMPIRMVAERVLRIAP